MEGAPSLLDLAWRAIYRAGFPVALAWWRLRRQPHQGALVAVYAGSSLLLLRPSYRAEWHFPGGGVRPGELPEAAAQRELEEEIGLPASALIPAGVFCGVWDGRMDRVHMFELRLDSAPALRLDNREIIEARLMQPAELPGLRVTGPVAAYLGRTGAGGGT